jgi:predicted nucleic acid-binding protein
MSVDQREFVDTNVLVYAHDGAAGNKHVRAKALLADLWANGNGCLSVQVLQEFYVNVTRKVSRPLNPEDARHLIEGLGTWMVHSPTSDDVVEAIRLHQAAQLSFWDAMILMSAARLGCSTVWSEDLGHGHVVGRVTIKNPFAA